MCCATLNCRFSYPSTYLGKGGVMPQLPPPVYPSRCDPPRYRRSLARRRCMMARTKTPEAAPAGAASGLVLASCLWYPRTRHRDRPAGAGYRWGCSHARGRRDRQAAPPPVAPAMHRCGRCNAPIQGSLRAAPETTQAKLRPHLSFRPSAAQVLSALAAI